MAINKQIDSASLVIEIQNGVDKAGDAIYKNKTFSGVRTDVNIEDAYAVAESIKGVLAADTRNYSLNEISNLVQN